MALTLAGAFALGVGLGILFFPHGFHASAGLVLGDDVTLLNELRSPGGMLLICGLFILAGAVRASVTAPALAVSAALYLSFGLSRVVGILLDGLPNSAMLQILALELLIGTICAGLLVAYRSRVPAPAA
nr:DUF4345 domain-containing protein [Seohaeicola saemankumensis]